MLKNQILGLGTLLATQFAFSQSGYITGTFFPALGTVTTTPFMPSINLAVGDLNSDGVDDLVAANSGWSIGPNIGAFRGLMLNEDSTPLGWFQAGAAPIAPNIGGYRAAATADFNNDGKIDVVTLSMMMDLSVYLNQGQQKTVAGFQNANHSTNINNVVGWVYTNQLTDRVPYIPVFKTDDFDGDGNQDLVIGFNMVHYWVQNFETPGLIFFWGRGDGTFDPPLVVPTNGGFAAVDADFVDWVRNKTAT